MKVILLANLPNLGVVGEIKEVSPGYARNFLFPKKLAQVATEKTIREAMARQKKIQEEEERLQEDAKIKARFLEKIVLTIKAKTNPEGKLFGSITNRDIKEAISKQASQEVDETRINIFEPIKKIGEYTVKIKLYKNIAANIKVKIVS